MRQIEKGLISAIENEVSYHKDNTRSYYDNGELIVLLHGNKIAYETSKGFYITCCGWNTVTTRSRLNSLVGVIGSKMYHGVRTCKGQLFVRYGKGEFAIEDSESFFIN